MNCPPFSWRDTLKFTRNRIVTRVPVAGSFDANGNPTTVASIAQTAVSDLILGNGSSSFSILQRDGSKKTVESIALLSAYSPTTTFEVLVTGSDYLYVTVNTEALGAAALTGIVALMEFNDPDHPEYWIPSKEGVARDANLTSNEWSLVGVGNKIIKSRIEHFHFIKARVSFKALAGAADAATKIVVSWHHAGHISLGEISGNDPV